MRNTFLSILLAVLCLTSSCENKQVPALVAENQKLQEEINKKDGLIDALIDFYSDIERDLEIISEKQWNISGIKPEDPQKKKQLSELSKRLQTDLQDLHNLMQHNKDKMQALKERLALRSEQMEKIQKAFESLHQKVEKKEAEIILLRTELSGVSEEYVKVFDDYLKKIDEADSLREQGHTLYFCVGTKKEFLQVKMMEDSPNGLKIITFPNSVEWATYCKTIEMQENATFNIAAKKINIVSHHPKNSYTIHKAEDKNILIQILLAKEFWSLSDYLMVVIEK